MRRILIGVAALCTLAVVGIGTSPAALAKSHKVTDPTIYDSTVSPSPGNLPSLGYEATQTVEFGNQITFGGTARVLDNVVVQMSSWGCQTGSGATCSTSPGATFSEPITLNIYAVGPPSADGPSTVTGSPIATETKTFAIPYRPSADPTDCSTAPDDGTQWYDAALATCFNGYLTDITFDFGHVTLPDSVIYGIAYNTSDYGAHPYGDSTACHAAGDCGYDALNVALSNDPPSPAVGSDPEPGTVYWDTGYAGFYCDGGAAGVGIFRIDTPAGDGSGATSGCWSVNGNTSAPYYVPAVQFNADTSPSPSFSSANNASGTINQSFSFTVTTTGVPDPSISKSGRLPHGLVLVNNGDGTATIEGIPTANNHVVSHFTLKARNAAGTATQKFTLTLG